MISWMSPLKFVSLILSVCCLTLSVPAQAQTIEWVRQYGTNTRDEAKAVAKGPTGVYVAGNTLGVMPGQTSAGPGDLDAFISRFDASGNALWTRQFGSTTVAQDDATGVATDQTGVYVVGWTNGALEGQTSIGSTDAFIRKYDANGTVLWTRQFGTIRQEEALAVTTDGVGIYVVGHVEGNLVGPDTGLVADAFIRRYDVNGNVIWTRQFGSANNEFAYGVATDSTGIYVAGTSDGDLAGQVGARDGFIRKFDSSGNTVWTRQFGTNTTDDLFALAVGSLGVYVAGDTAGTFPGQTKAGGLYDAYVIKFDTSGNQQWVRQWGTIYDDWVLGLAVGGGSLAVVGSAGDSLTSQPYTGSAVILLYDFDGALQTTPIQFGDSANDVVNAIVADATGAYAVGPKHGTALNQVHLGDADAYVMKITLPPPTSLAFSITNLTGVSTATDGTGDLTIGHATIETSNGTTPSGVAIFGYSQDGVLVTEAGVPDSPLITSGRIYGEISATGAVDTGVAISNPNNQTAVINFIVIDSAGVTLRSGSTSIAANQQIALFLTQDPFLVAKGFRGAVTLASNVPVGIIALRSLINERNDFLITTLPVTDLSKGVSTGTQVIPHFAVGDGWGTNIILVNPSDVAQTGTVQFLGPGSGTTAATAATVNIDGIAGSSTTYTVAPRSSVKLVISAATAGLTFGSVRIVPTNGGPVPTPLVIFGYKPGPFTLSEAGVPVTMGTSFRMYAEVSTSPAILSGFAIANTTNVAATVTFELLTLQGASAATSTTRTLPPSGQLVGFLDNFFPNLPQPFQGVLRVTTTAGSVSVVALRQRYNQRGDYLITTTPPTLETGVASAATRAFPHFVNGGGYTTQFILFSGTTGQISDGTVKFKRQNGVALGVRLR